MLENTIRTLCQQKLVVLQSLCAEPELSAEVVEIERCYYSLLGLVEIAHIQRHGLSGTAENHLQQIESEAARLIRLYRES